MTKDRIVLLGSGSFGIPAFNLLCHEYDCALVISQPDRPAGRGMAARRTPVSEWATLRGLPLLRVEDVNEPEVVAQVNSISPVAIAVVAFGQKLGPELIGHRPCINLHGSLLPRWRGAAPVQRSLMEADEKVGACVIRVAPRMDAGQLLAVASTQPMASETSGELHDRLAEIGAPLLLQALRGEIGGTSQPVTQDEAFACRARKLTRSDAWVDLTRSPREIAARINGLNPWPSCEALLAGIPVRIRRARAVLTTLRTTGDLGSETLRISPGFPPEISRGGLPEVATIGTDFLLHCRDGAVELLQVQAAGGKEMDLAGFLRGRRVQLPCPITSASPKGS